MSEMVDVVESATVKMAEIARGMQQDGGKAQQFSQSFANMTVGQERRVDTEIKKVQLESMKLDLELKRLEVQKAKADAISKKTN